MDDQPSTKRPTIDRAAVRVWAESQADGSVLLTWELPAAGAERDAATDARAVAATVGVLEGVTSAVPHEGGVLVIFDPEAIDRQRIAGAVRDALSLEDDLRARVSALVKRVPAYAGLARSLALDDRVSPLPEVGRQAATRRATPTVPAGVPTSALRYVPGFRLLSQVQTVLPVLRALSSWSRTAPPGVVQEHLSAVGMSREQLDADLATANEALAFARAYASEKASVAARKASVVSAQARERGREWLRQQQEAYRQARDEPPAGR